MMVLVLQVGITLQLRLEDVFFGFASRSITCYPSNKLFILIIAMLRFVILALQRSGVVEGIDCASTDEVKKVVMFLVRGEARSRFHNTFKQSEQWGYSSSGQVSNCKCSKWFLVKHQYRIAPQSISLDEGEDPTSSYADGAKDYAERL